MKSFSTMILPLVALGLGGCGSDSDDTLTPVAQTLSRTDTLSVPGANDLTVGAVSQPVLPGLNSSQDRVSFVSPLQGQYQPSPPQILHSNVSDEYWVRVSGKELNQGMKLSVSQSGSLIRLAPRADLSSGQTVSPDAIAPEAIQLTRPGADQSSASLVKTRVDSQALATAGLTDNSSALQLSDAATAGTYQLKVSQPLQADAIYLLNVKEKGSPFQLTMTAPTTLASQPQAASISFQLDMSRSDNQLQPEAFLRLADGREQALKVNKQQGQWQAELPTQSMASSNAGLNEIHVRVNTQVDGKPIQRTVKSAYKPYIETAALQREITSQWQDALPHSLSFTLDVAAPGRFQLGAILTGSDANGNEVQLLSTQVADWLTPDANILVLPLDSDLIKASGLQAPFRLRALELKDQGQMARLSLQETALELK